MEFVAQDTPIKSSARQPAICNTCRRPYASPLDLLPVIITGVDDITPDAINTIAGYSTWSDGEYSNDKLPNQLTASDRTKLCAILSSSWEEDGVQDVKVLLASGDSGVCKIQGGGDTKSCWIDLVVDILPRITPAIAAAKQANPFRPSVSTTVSVRDVWTAGSPNPTISGNCAYTWLHRLPGVADHYLGIGGLCFASPTAGTFELSLYTDGPNMGSDGGPTFRPVTKLFCINFAVAPQPTKL
jgi:hypothetical protein